MVQDLKQLDQSIRALASTPASAAPVLNCYVDRESPEWRSRFDEEASRLRAAFPAGESRRWFDEALLRIKTHLRLVPEIGARGAAVFARGGDAPFLLPLEFRIPLPGSLSASRHPRIFPLVALRDNYYRFAILHCTGEAIRIFGIELGSVSCQVCDRRIDPRRFARASSPGSPAGGDRLRELIRDGVAVLGQFLRRGGYRCLILAGTAEWVALIRQAMPRQLAVRVLDTVPAQESDALMDVVQAASLSFTDREEEESAAMVEWLCGELDEGRSVTGLEAARLAVESGEAEVLLIDARFAPDSVRNCLHCGGSCPDGGGPFVCPLCGYGPSLPGDEREALVRAAVAAGVPVEIVNHSDVLMGLGGVGCLLKHGPRGRRRAA